MTRLSAEQRRSALMRAAFTVIERVGIQAATTRAIVAEADMPLASFHYTFRSRDDMIRELIATVVENESLAAKASVTDGATIRDIVRAGLQAYFELLVAEPHREQAMLELLHYALRTSGLEDLPAQQYESYHRAAAELLATGATAAGIEWSIPLDQLARLLITQTDGITLAWLATRDHSAAEQTMDFAADAIAAFASSTEPQTLESPQ